MSGLLLELIRSAGMNLNQIPSAAMPWVEQFDIWFYNPERSLSTQRAYRVAWADALGFAKKGPWEIRGHDLAAWIDSKRPCAWSPATINQKLSALGSFYRYAMGVEIIHPDGNRTKLCNHNPANIDLRPRVQPYTAAAGFTMEQARALLFAIDTSTVQGLRDHALFSLYLATGMPNVIRTLRKKDLRIDIDGAVHYRCSRRGCDVWDDFPQDLWRFLMAYLGAAGRPFASLADGDYLFTALCDRAVRLPHMVGREYDPAAQPLSARTVGSLLKTYAKRAGLNPARISVRTLRHTTASLMVDAGFSAVDIQRQLGHASVATTQYYLAHRPRKRNNFWAVFRVMAGS